MFNQEFNLTWKQLNIGLGFDEAWLLDLDSATHRFKKVEFWESITTSHNCSNPRLHEIHNPILHFLSCWMSITLFPDHNVRTLRSDELKLLLSSPL